MGVQLGATGSIFGLNWARSANDTVVSTDHNYDARALEFLGQVLTDLGIENGILAKSPARCQFNSSTKRITAPTAELPIVGLIDGRPFYMTADMEETGTATSGGTTWLRCSALDDSDDGFWPSATVIFTSGTNNGLARTVSAYDNSTKQLSWASALPIAVAPGDTFVVTFFYIGGLTNNATNYIYLREWTKLTTYGVVQFVATVSGTASGSDLLIATATLDSGGTVTASDNNPTGAARNLHPGIGRVDVVTETYLLSGLLAGATSAEFDIDHDDFAYIGGRTVTSDDATCTPSLTKYWKSNQVSVQVVNGGSYTASPTITLTITGRLHNHV